MLKQCPVCAKKLEESHQKCPACDSDLSFIEEVSSVGLRLRESAEKEAESGDIDKAILYCQMALESSPDDADLLRLCAEFYEKKDDVSNALLCWQQYQAIIPDDKDAVREIEGLSLQIARLKKVAAPRSLFLNSMLVVFCTTVLVVFVSGYIFHLEKQKNERNLSVNAEQLEGIKKKRDADYLKEMEYREYVRSLEASLPKSLHIEPYGQGAKLSGSLHYQWEKHELEHKVKEWKCAFVDMTGLVVEAPNAIRYQVQQGDSLYKIARKFSSNGASWVDILAMNSKSITNPDDLEVGEIIVVNVQ
jgi:hypothetical protein